VYSCCKTIVIYLSKCEILPVLSINYIKNTAWSYTSTPQYAFIAWCSVLRKHRDTFTFIFTIFYFAVTDVFKIAFGNFTNSQGVKTFNVVFHCSHS